MSSTRVGVLVRGLLFGVALVLHSWCARAHDESLGWRAPSGKFTIAVIPDTQYLFDEDRGNRAVVGKSLQWIVDHTREENIVFTVHLGDIVNYGGSARWGRAELRWRCASSCWVGLAARSTAPYLPRQLVG